MIPLVLITKLRVYEDIQKLREEGLPCLGNQCRCDQTFSLDEICSALQPEQIEALAQRLDAAFQPADSALIDQEVQHLSRCMIDAFNLHCPNEGCGGILDKIEGCNAATCSNKECKARFCYLCLKPQEDGPANHAHARQHSKDFWEKRPGYTERYHWLLARKRLAFVFQQRVDPTVRKALLNAQHRMLKERKMWPFPAGIMSAKWIQEIQSDRQLNPKERMALLQNEFIYQRQRGNSSNATQVEAEIRRLGGKVLASLDVGDAGGINPQPFTSAAAGVGARVQPHAQEMVPGLEPVQENDPRVTRNFAALGEMYQIAGFIWSGMAPGKMNQADAIQYCQGLGGGARLPKKKEWAALARALGKDVPGRQYDPDLLPDTKYLFWSSSSYQEDANKGYLFNGYNGSIFSHNCNNTRWVSCVVPAVPVVPLNPVIRPAPAPVVQPNLARQNPIVPVMEQSIPKPAPKPAPIVVQPPREIRPDPNAIIPVMADDPRVSDAFRRLGNMYQVDGLIWSAVAPNQMNHPDATQYCQSLGGGARLPTKKELEALARVLGKDVPGRGFNPELLHDIQNRFFWSSSIPPELAEHAFVFDGHGGGIGHYHSKKSHVAVRCVIEVRPHTQLQQGAVATSSHPASGSIQELRPNSHAIVLVAPNDPRMTRSFAVLGAMHEAAGLIWSGVAPNKMNHANAVAYCQSLGGGARLPTEEEWEALKRAMSPGGQYNPNLLPDMKGKGFWSSSIRFYFVGTDGYVGIPHRLSNLWVRCALEVGAAQMQPQQRVVASSSNSISSATQELRPNSDAIIQVAPNDPRVSPAFSSLGPMYQAVGFIWSGVAPNQMNHYDTEKYCQSLRARLPTNEEWEALKGVITTASRTFSPELLPGTSGKWFWSSVSSRDSDRAFSFNGDDGGIFSVFRGFDRWVRCVVVATTEVISSSSVTGAPKPVIQNDARMTPALVQPPREVRANPNAIIPVMEDDPRVSHAFRRLGNMYQVGGLLWSGVAPSQMIYSDATQYCQDLGGGARLPTEEEWEVLKRAMSPGGQYNPNLLPDMRGKVFWSSSVNPYDASYALLFYGSDGSGDSNLRDYDYWVRCVIERTTTQQQQTIASYSDLVSSSTQSVPTPSSHAIELIAPNDLRVTPAFAALGNMYQVGGLIWSGVAPKEMDHYDAEKYCQGLGGGARLPTKEEFEALIRVMTLSSGKYNPDLLPGTSGKWFWSSSVNPGDSSLAFRFGAFAGVVRDNRRNLNRSVRCVIERTTIQQQHAVASYSDLVSSSTQPVPIPSSHTIELITPNDLRVTRAFAALGDMYEAGGLIWSGVASRKMSQSDAIWYCQTLGGGARLPTKEEWEALAKAMSTGGRYNPESLPGTGGISGKWFWSSSDAPDDADFAFNFGGKQGGVAFEERSSGGFVRCVMTTTTSSSPTPKPAPKLTTPSALGTFVSIPAGRFQMGSSTTEANHDHDERQHEVSLSTFEMGEAVVTQEVYASVMGSNPSNFKKAKYCPKMFKKIQVKGVQIPICPDHPVEMVSWDDAQEFIRLVNHEFYWEGYTYSLPTEAQTEYAIRGGTTTEYVSGADEKELGKYVIYESNSSDQTQPVKSKLPNRFGIYRGGVAEWTLDWYSEDYEGSHGLDPKGPFDGLYRVIRGGGWSYFAQGCRSAIRSGGAQDFRRFSVGFRLVRTPN